jgi:hypothetical protein
MGWHTKAIAETKLDEYSQKAGAREEVFRPSTQDTYGRGTQPVVFEPLGR